MNKPEQFEHFFSGYLAAALWSSSDEIDGEHVNLDDPRLTLDDDTKSELRDGSAKFFIKHYSLLSDYVEKRTVSVDSGVFAEKWSCAGHDFWLNRCGHGTGFWDRDIEEGNLLDELVGYGTEFPNIDLYISDDMKICC